MDTLHMLETLITEDNYLVRDRNPAPNSIGRTWQREANRKAARATESITIVTDDMIVTEGAQ